MVLRECGKANYSANAESALPRSENPVRNDGRKIVHETTHSATAAAHGRDAISFRLLDDGHLGRRELGASDAVAPSARPL
jgi:hypothetical protein